MTPNTQDTYITYIIIVYTMLTNDPLNKDHYELPPGFEPKTLEYKPVMLATTRWGSFIRIISQRYGTTI